AADVSTFNIAGTYTGVGVTYGVAGSIPGDPDKSVTFNGTSGRVTRASTTGLPTGSQSVRLGCAGVMTANPGTLALPAQIGNFNATHAFEIIINTTGTVQAAVVGGTSTTAGAALSLSTWHLIDAWYDSATGQVSVYVDGALYGGPTTQGI